MEWFVKAFIRASLVWFTAGIALGLALSASADLAPTRHRLWATLDDIGAVGFERATLIAASVVRVVEAERSDNAHRARTASGTMRGDVSDASSYLPIHAPIGVEKKKRPAQTVKSKRDAVLSSQWAWVELNYRPHAYQACALTT
jgi:hypothetical protein